MGLTDPNIAAVRAESICAACGGGRLVPHLSVAGEIGPDGLIPTTSAFGTALADIVRCRDCGHMQLRPMPEAATLSGAYAGAESEDYVEEEAGQRETARRTLDRIARRLPAPADPPALLDLGCWVGFLLAEARDRGWRATGVEPSAFASRYARERLGLDVVTADLFAAELPPHAYDVVTLGDVIEHLVDPAAALARIESLLVPGGLLWLALPDAGSAVARLLGRRWWSVIPTHVQYFTRPSITLLLRRAGFDVLEVATAPKAFTVAYYLDRVGGYSPRAGRALRAAAERSGAGRRMWAPDFRDRMSVIARALPHGRALG
jgi:SAM-dependent methyltransferase